MGTSCAAPSPRLPPRLAGPMPSPCCRSARRSAFPTPSPAASPATRRPSSSKRPTSHRVADPAAGSGAIEALTDALCETAWWLFQEIERAGGVAAALKAGLIQRGRARVRAEREAQCRAPQGHADRHQRLPRSRRGQGRRCWRSRAARALCPTQRERHCRRSGSPSRSSACATAATPISPSMAQGPRCSSPVSAAPPISMRGRASPRACSSPAASKRSEGKRRQPRETIQGIGREACLPLLLRQGL